MLPDFPILPIQFLHIPFQHLLTPLWMLLIQLQQLLPILPQQILLMRLLIALPVLLHPIQSNHILLLTDLLPTVHPQQHQFRNGDQYIGPPILKMVTTLLLQNRLSRWKSSLFPRYFHLGCFIQLLLKTMHLHQLLLRHPNQHTRPPFLIPPNQTNWCYSILPIIEIRYSQILSVVCIISASIIYWFWLSISQVIYESIHCKHFFFSGNVTEEPIIYSDYYL